MTLVKSILDTAQTVQNHRTTQDILLHAMTELGELALEIQIDQGKSYKSAGDDGIVGEALDMIACMVDMIHVHSPQLTEDDLIAMLHPKLAKWQAKSALIQRRAGS